MSGRAALEVPAPLAADGDGVPGELLWGALISGVRHRQVASNLHQNQASSLKL